MDDGDSIFGRTYAQWTRSEEEKTEDAQNKVLLSWDLRRRHGRYCSDEDDDERDDKKIKRLRLSEELVRQARLFALQCLPNENDPKGKRKIPPPPAWLTRRVGIEVFENLSCAIDERHWPLDRIETSLRELHGLHQLFNFSKEEVLHRNGYIVQKAYDAGRTRLITWLRGTFLITTDDIQRIFQRSTLCANYNNNNKESNNNNNNNNNNYYSRFWSKPPSYQDEPLLATNYNFNYGRKRKKSKKNNNPFACDDCDNACGQQQEQESGNSLVGGNVHYGGRPKEEIPGRRIYSDDGVLLHVIDAYEEKKEEDVTLIELAAPPSSPRDEEFCESIFDDPPLHLFAPDTPYSYNSAQQEKEPPP